MGELRWSVAILLWLARITGGVLLLISLAGLAYFGFKIDVFAGAFAISMAVAVFAPQRWFVERDTRLFLFVLVLLGFLGPLRLVIEQWPNLLMGHVPIAQCVPLVLFLCVIVMGGWSRGRGKSQGEESPPPRTV